MPPRLVRNAYKSYNVLEKGTVVVQSGIIEACMLVKTSLKSPSEKLLNEGASLLQPTSSYYAGIQKISDAIDSADEGTDIFECKAHKRKEVEDRISQGPYSYSPSYTSFFPYALLPDSR